MTSPKDTVAAQIKEAITFGSNQITNASKNALKNAMEKLNQLIAKQNAANQKLNPNAALKDSTKSEELNKPTGMNRKK